MGIIKRLLGIKDDSKEQMILIESKFSEIQEKVLAEVAGLRNDNAALKSEISSKNSRITDLLTKLRDQNEADLLFECKRIEKKILDGEKRQEINSQLAALQSMQNSYQSLLAAQPSGLSNLLGGAWR